MDQLKPIHFVLPVTAIAFVVVCLVGFFKFRPKDAGFTLPIQPVSKWDILCCGAIAMGFYLLALWRLAEPQRAVFDEIYHARTGMEYVLGVNPFEWTHPPLAKLCMAVSLRIFGGHFDPKVMETAGYSGFTVNDVLGWRYASVVFGVFALVLTYVLTRLITKNRHAATLAMGMLAVDGIFFVMSRIAMTNIFTVCFILLASIGGLKVQQTSDRRWMLLLGLGLGCAIASRWTTLFAWGLLALWMMGCDLGGKKSALALLKLVPWYLLAFFVLPLAIYLLAYVPFLRQGSGHKIAEVLDYQVQMWNYHTQLRATHPYSSQWWSWPLVLRPAWLHYEGVPNNRVAGIWAIGNVFVWWASVPALVAIGYVARKVRRSDVLLITMMGLGLWLLWGAQSFKGGRQLIFLHYYFEAVPFACIALAYLGVLFWQNASVNRQNVLAAYGFAILLWFGMYYPLLSAMPIPDWYKNWHLWQPGELWIR
jgi:dolichyl-phosphate-mannose-protein mannosyltransferase